MGDLREPIIGTEEEKPVLSAPSSSNPNPSSIGLERWARAEEATHKIICQVQPTAVSEERRREVIDYVQRLIRASLGCEVFPFGSVPLKAYLPDGDIDLTAFSGASVEEALVNDVVSVLEAEDQNMAAEFIVKDVQLIWAEVKLVKCIIQNIVVDISFNQLGGLCTLCFLEQVDRLIGKDHLFKRSIILIKAWCYYESRVLGAHHGLISSYALETLVLYIFHLFHSKLDGPLAVLYRFLDYFSKFDWDNYCVSLRGPIRVSSLPEIVAEKPENGGSDLLLSKDFLSYCVDNFSVPSRGIDTNSRTFPQKHLNIVDPLKENNNLGRSVSKGNFCRIRSAFTLGARKLERILLQSTDSIAGELYIFFSNTLDRHGSGQRPDVQDLVLMLGDNGFVPAFAFSETESSQEEKKTTESERSYSVCLNGTCKLDSDGSSHNGVNNIEVSEMGMKTGRIVSGHQKGAMEVVCSKLLSKTDGYINRTAIGGCHFYGDAENLSISKIHGQKLSNGTTKAFPEESMSQRNIARHAPHLYFSGTISGNGKLGHGNSDMKEPSYSSLPAERVSCRLLPVPDEGTDISVDHGGDKNVSVGNHEVQTTVLLEDGASVSNSVASSTAGFHPGYREKTTLGAAGSPEYLNSLSDLTGNYDSHLNSLHYGKLCYMHSSSVPAFPVPPALTSEFQSKISLDAIRHSYQFKRNGFHNVKANGVIPRSNFYRMNTLLIPGATFGGEEMPKPRGTGTYIPNAQNHPPYRNPWTGRGKNQGPVRSPRNNGRTLPPMEANLLDSTHEHSQLQFSDQVNGKSGPSVFYESGFSGVNIRPDVNGLLLQSEGAAEFGSGGHVPIGASLPENHVHLNHASLFAQTSTQGLPMASIRKSEPVLEMKQNRVMPKSSYRLKDVDDFPPLSI
ncbi:uncharacterized protein LOC130772804 isoform X1 [Actinidia eriantha]|uniref:uncharacterized protein LOC130772804 isoform X1 n=1 Tax=Actinidia eriantha TaxID=165200 RepID=UPI00258E338D|nr:uncharacterized protein LOC130772804 isoform X1 [Actinidia eriantha]